MGGFQSFMVCQTRVRQENRHHDTKHRVRLRHASRINGSKANEIILLNSHDGTSSYQMFAGMFRFVPCLPRRRRGRARTNVDSLMIRSRRQLPTVLQR